MKILISIEHPALVHQFRYIITWLRNKGHDVLVLVVDKDGDKKLLDSFGIPYKLVSNSTGKGVLEKAFLFIWLTIKYSFIGMRYHPDYFIGRSSPMMAVASFLCHKKHIIYEDTEGDKFSLTLCKLFSYKIITSSSFLLDLGKKQDKVNAYKELFYLHPNYFVPDIEIVRKNGLNPEQDYIILRFVAWQAVHDFGQKGISDRMLHHMVEELSKVVKIYISSEKELPEDLKKYELRSNYEDIHHILAYSKLYMGESTTMSSEAAVLGIHAICLNSIVCGSTSEIQDKYGLMYVFSQPDEGRYEQGLQKALELLKKKDLTESGKQKQKILLKDKIDINQYFISMLEKEEK